MTRRPLGFGRHVEVHLSGRAAWLRAAVLGADDGIVSTASLMIGVAASDASRSAIVTAGLAGLVAGAMSMAAGEYVSVSSQRDAEVADIAREQAELAADPEFELHELTEVYEQRGLDHDLARQVAVQLTKVDPLGTHLRDELGVTEGALARPAQASVVSALSFALGAVLPLLVLLVAPASARIPVIAVAALVFLAVLGVVGSRLGGAAPGRAAVRVVVGGGAAMLLTALIGRVAGAAGL